jgi:hypothetical protein
MKLILVKDILQSIRQRVICNVTKFTFFKKNDKKKYTLAFFLGFNLYAPTV